MRALWCRRCAMQVDRAPMECWDGRTHVWTKSPTDLEANDAVSTEEQQDWSQPLQASTVLAVLSDGQQPVGSEIRAFLIGLVEATQ